MPKDDESYINSCHERMKECWIKVEAKYEEYLTSLCGSDKEPPDEEDKWIENIE